MTRRKRNPDGAGTITKRKDSRYQAAVHVLQPGGTRARKFAYGKTWAECDTERRELLAKVDQGVPAGDHRRTAKESHRVLRTALTAACHEELVMRNVATLVEPPSAGCVRRDGAEAQGDQQGDGRDRGRPRDEGQNDDGRPDGRGALRSAGRLRDRQKGGW
ncbi:hypothetical protein ACIBCU_31495 [Streptomyces sp. NPDC051064]|uniref:hypothetical protein n=1 Tax=Streptomyces sp. NPDC051064 TaxID=3365641 RepID=UPI00379C337E